MEVKIELKETSQPLVVLDAVNTYTKGKLFCVYLPDGKVQKFPLDNIWRITEDYSG